MGFGVHFWDFLVQVLISRNQTLAKDTSEAISQTPVLLANSTLGSCNLHQGTFDGISAAVCRADHLMSLLVVMLQT